MKVDLVMWTKNSAKTLPLVLKRINEVIPDEEVYQRIIVDDHSQDDTVEIAKHFGWDVYPNPATGIPSAANEALRRVQTEFFISFEHDVVLSREWWNKIPKHMDDPKVAVAQGVRIATHPVTRKIEEFILEKRDLLKMYISIDNNIYRTNVIKSLGGFPYHCPISVDQYLRDRVWQAGYKWIIDKTVVSSHIRPSIREDAEHVYRLSLQTERRFDVGFLYNFRLFLFSPLSALRVILYKGCPQIFYVYPYYRFMRLKALLHRGKIRWR